MNTDISIIENIDIVKNGYIHPEMMSFFVDIAVKYNIKLKEITNKNKSIYASFRIENEKFKELKTLIRSDIFNSYFVFNSLFTSSERTAKKQEYMLLSFSFITYEKYLNVDDIKLLSYQFVKEFGITSKKELLLTLTEFVCEIRQKRHDNTISKEEKKLLNIAKKAFTKYLYLKGYCNRIELVINNLHNKRLNTNGDPLYHFIFTIYGERFEWHLRKADCEFVLSQDVFKQSPLREYVKENTEQKAYMFFDEKYIDMIVNINSNYSIGLLELA